MNKTENYKLVPKKGNRKCFGCGLDNPAGLQMKFYSNGESLFSWLTVPDHLCGWNDLVHGGVISTILDEIMSWSAIYLLKKIILTKSITVDFIKPVFSGKELKVEGKVFEVKNEKEAILEGLIYDTNGKIHAKSRGTFALLQPEVAQRLGIMDEKTLKDFEPLLRP
ncbi:MAG: PaaI family thioesterase [Desulfobacterales bacterium]|nr:PaaI family thioesterase [Desulfobacterales bacterium]